MGTYKVKLSLIAQEFNFRPIYKSSDYEDVEITTTDINRPAIQFAGFYEYFNSRRMQVIGIVETKYVQSLPPEKRLESFDRFFSNKVPALVVCHGMKPLAECEEMAKKHDVSLFSTERDTSDCIAGLMTSLKAHLARRITRHGVLVEVLGEGILLLGESGIGKSETAVELVKRGHRLVADDAVEIKQVSDNSLLGSAPESIRHFIELRGLGVVDVSQLFGVGAVKSSVKIDLVVNLEQWKENSPYDRLGIENQYMTIMGVDVPSLTIPVKPGRNLAVIIEVAAMNNRQRKLGHSAADELMKKVNEQFDAKMG